MAQGSNHKGDKTEAKAKVLLTGGTGFIGKRLTKALKEKGYAVGNLSRKSKLKGQNYFWDPQRNWIDTKALDWADYIVHLAGAPIAAKRWTQERKYEIIDSRVESAKLLFNSITEHHHIKAFISSSAVGYYGGRTEKKEFTEEDPPASDFQGTVCKRWEAAADHFSQVGARVVKIRTGVVFDSKAGAYPLMAAPFKRGVGAILGNGQQYIPWIHADDLIQIYIKALEDENMEGAYNGVSGDHVTNAELSKLLARKFGNKIWLPKVPVWVLKLAMGQRSELVLEGNKVSAQKIKDAGFIFRYPDIDSALDSL